jgi:hypothetical protein
MDVQISQLHFAGLSGPDSKLDYGSRPDWIAQCQKCQGQVVFDRDSFQRRQACPKCGERYYRALCVEGDHYVLISNDTLLEFSNSIAINCPYPQCDFVLVALSYPIPEVRYESLNIVAWEEDQRRQDFRDRAHQRIPAGYIVLSQTPRARPPFFPVQTSKPPAPQDDRSRFEEYHFTTGARLKQAEYYLLHIHKEYGRFSVEKSVLGEGLPEFIRHDLLLRGFVMNLRSALDVLCQEILLYYKIPIEEMEVDFGRANVRKKLPSTVAAHITQFSDEWAYVYLNRLRNVLEHRRAPLPRKLVSTSVPVCADGRVGPARPQPDVQFLADDPEIPPGAETFELQREICSVCHNLLYTVNDFVLTTYEAAQ